MSNILWKNLYLCLPKFKCLSTTLPSSQEDDDHHSLLSPTPIIKNFNTFYHLTPDSTTTSGDLFSSSDNDSDTDNSPPDLATVFASQRFFFSSPGHSNSILEPPPPESNTLSTAGGGVAVQTYSPDPYSDFRRSMQEMVEARELVDVKANWDYLHELLLCYLNLNPKHTHKFIISAFSDLLVSLLPSTAAIDHRRKPECRQRSAVSRRLF